MKPTPKPIVENTTSGDIAPVLVGGANVVRSKFKKSRFLKGKKQESAASELVRRLIEGDSETMESDADVEIPEDYIDESDDFKRGYIKGHQDGYDKGFGEGEESGLDRGFESGQHNSQLFAGTYQ